MPERRREEPTSLDYHRAATPTAGPAGRALHIVQRLGHSRLV